ncbi:MAG: hypothetical protein AAFZ15_30070 [Bacteroidota bacterium]
MWLSVFNEVTLGLTATCFWNGTEKNGWSTFGALLLSYRPVFLIEESILQIAFQSDFFCHFSFAHFPTQTTGCLPVLTADLVGIAPTTSRLIVEVTRAPHYCGSIFLKPIDKILE